MNIIAEEIRTVMDDDELMHYGMPRRSGRYPWGSGDDPYQHNNDFYNRVQEMKKNGMSEHDIAASLGIVNDKGEPSSTLLRRDMTIAKEERRIYQVETAKRLRDKEGMGPTAIGKEMGLNESTVRSLLDAGSEAKMYQSRETADFIRKMIDEKGMIDVGTGVEKELGISKEMLEVALRRLDNEGYPIYKGGVPQVTNPGQQTNQRVICPKGTEHKEIYNFDKIHPLNEDQYISRDGGKTFEKKFTYPASMDSKRLAIRYAEDGGTMKDGIIELRRGVDDLSLGNSRYAQVRILVDGTHYLKGMAVYSDNMPDGVDVVFNTNKKKGTPMTSVLKEIKDDPDNPFGSLIKDANQGGQYWYTDKKTGEKKLGLINKRADEGDWNDWADALPSQFLSKQALPMVKKQLDIAKSDKYAEFDEIKSLTNPTVKKHLLQKFADECDSAAVHLKAAALPGQKYHVIIPINSLKENEIYAPNYENGTKLALIRYPHGGTFEIPILTVNNKHAPARKLLGDDVVDAVGITSKVAERLSGADFDGDTVMCIPTHDKAGKVKISNRPPLADLDGFDPKLAYGYDKKTVDKDGTEHYYRNGREFKHMTKRGLQTQMGVISNLITDMTLDGGATDAELAAAVKHSMVIIDSYKHHLDYKESEIANNISALHKKYQGKASGGAGTIVSRAKGQDSVVKRQGTPKVNEKGKEWYDPSKPEGSLIYKDADDAHYTYKKVNRKTGEVTTETGTRMQKTTKMANTDDAYTLVSAARNPKELAYADYANSMKALANQARLEMVHTGKIEYSSTAKNTYKKEVDSLMVKLNQAQLNTTRERAAQRMANAEIQAKQKANPNMDKSEIKKASQQALSKYRDALGSISRRDRNIDITDKEWEAIQAGAISENKLKQILDNTDVAKLRERATPRSTKSLSTSQINRIRAMSSTYTLEQIASKFNVSPSTISKYLKGGN
ncbi:MAG: helix-turn-helix domain-containing protein [Lachnospiraceae bacterium]|nr:helix-turn-helix domain-containing protein [Lachnospiraceae bacterium]